MADHFTEGARRGPMFESLSEFFERRIRELVKIPKFGRMNALDLADIVENEFYECANDAIPPSDELGDRASSILQ